MINRGWVPPERVSPKSRMNAQIKGKVTFDAIVRHTEKVSFYITSAAFDFFDASFL